MSKYYKSHTVKRQVRRAGTVETVQVFKVKSFTNIEAPAIYRPTINHTTGRGAHGLQFISRAKETRL